MIVPDVLAYGNHKFNAMKTGDDILSIYKKTLKDDKRDHNSWDVVEMWGYALWLESRLIKISSLNK
jgi:hypothetical protein